MCILEARVLVTLYLSRLDVAPSETGKPWLADLDIHAGAFEAEPDRGILLLSRAFVCRL